MACIKRVGLHRLVDVERRQALDVEAGQPHRADDRDPERMLGILEGDPRRPPASPSGVSKPCLHHGAVRNDVEAPLLEIRDLVLRLADDDLDDGLLHPLCLARSCLDLLGRRSRSSSLEAGSQLCFLPAISASHLCRFACQRGMIRWNIRAQVILSMHTSMDLPDSQRVAQCSTKSAASLSSRSSAVMTS